MMHDGGVRARHRLARLQTEINTIENRGASRPALNSPVSLRDVQAQSNAFLPIGVTEIDQQLGGGLPRHGLCELAGQTMRDSAAVTGFVLALMGTDRVTSAQPILWISTGDIIGEAGLIYGHGLTLFGLKRERFLFVHMRTIKDALWTAEEAARTPGMAGIVLDMRAMQHGPDLKQTRRLHLRARGSGSRFFLLYHAGIPRSSATPLRLVIKPAPAYTDQSGLRNAIGPPGFCVAINKNKSGPAGSVHTIYWRHDEHRFFIPDTETNRAKRNNTATSRTAHTNSGGLFPVVGNRPNHAEAFRASLAKTG